MQIITPHSSKIPFSFVLFDFDGTISLIREGWQGIMNRYFVEVLENTPLGYEKDILDLQILARDLITFHTGRQTIYQCIALSEEVQKLGGTPLNPQAYKDEYHQRLLEKINYRLEGLREGRLDSEPFTVPGTYQLLDMLKSRGLTLFLASGTDEHYVLEEARLLKVDHYFEGHIYGAQLDYKTFSKKMVIKRLLSENNLHGAELLGFGDGYVEIENIVGVGGYAVGVASNESERSGIDLWKKERLIQAGAHMVIPDYRDIKEIEERLFN